MQIEIIHVSVENKGKHRVANVTYKGQDGKVDAKKSIVSFVFKDVFKTMSEAKLGDIFDVKTVKNDKGYWDWTEAVPAGKNSSPSGKSYPEAVRKGGDWETAEERAKKQVYIVRQSSITAALGLAERNGFDTLTENDIIRSAKLFEEYVFGMEPLREADVE